LFALVAAVPMLVALAIALASTCSKPRPLSSFAAKDLAETLASGWHSEDPALQENLLENVLIHNRLGDPNNGSEVPEVLYPLGCGPGDYFSADSPFRGGASP
jgi:hypothetical protein